MWQVATEVAKQGVDLWPAAPVQAPKQARDGTQARQPRCVGSLMHLHLR